MEVKYFTQPFDCNGNSFYLGIKLNEILKSENPPYDKIWIVTSFAKKSGISKLKAGLKKAIKNNTEINIILGTGKSQTTVEALNELQSIGCKIKVYRNCNGNSLGAKVYCFEVTDSKAEVYITSGNITEGGLYKNYEMIVNVSYDLANGDMPQYMQFKESVCNFFEPTEKFASELSQELIDILVETGEISYESDYRAVKRADVIKNEVASKEADESDGMDLLSIILPTGDSIEVSLNELQETNEKVQPIVDMPQKHESVEIKEEATETSQDDELDIEVEESERVEENEHLKDSKDVLDELLEEGYSDKDDDKSKDKKHDKMVHLENYEVIDIEQMLYKQYYAEGTEEEIKDNPAATIRQDDIEFIKSNQTKETKEETKEDADEQHTVQSVNKKFIMSSSSKKNNNGAVNTFFIQINKLKGRGISGEVRMPVAARDFSPEFWGWPSSYCVYQSEGKSHKKYKKWQTECKVIDVENPNDAANDTVELYQEEGKSNFNFYSKKLISLEPEENDIIRIIRCPKDDECVFQCELIRAKSKEYEIWEQFCSNVIKGTERRYGFA